MFIIIFLKLRRNFLSRIVKMYSYLSAVHTHDEKVLKMFLSN